MFKDKEVMTIMFHFILSIVVVGAYLLTVITDHPDTMLQSAALIVVGYWFGAVGGTKAIALMGGDKKPSPIPKDKGDDSQ